MKALELTKQKFNRLLVLGKTTPPPGVNSSNLYWLVECECGVQFKINTGDIKRSKGCKKCGNRSQGLKVTTHGDTRRSRFYRIWRSFKNRCKDPEIKDYCARGIYVEESWLKYENFKLWAESTYIEGLTLDRIDNDGPYAPWNCRWATKEEQTLNRRVSLKVDIGDGKIVFFKEAAKLAGLSVHQLRYRLINLNMSYQEAKSKGANKSRRPLR